MSARGTAAYRRIKTASGGYPLAVLYERRIVSEKDQPPQDQREKDDDFGIGIAIGLPLGVGVGVALGNIGMGLALGMAIATLWQAISRKRRNKDGANLALGLAVGALLIVVLIWALIS
jgi:hypothetical protein